MHVLKRSSESLGFLHVHFLLQNSAKSEKHGFVLND
jgi:hypothetical protein